MHQREVSLDTGANDVGQRVEELIVVLAFAGVFIFIDKDVKSVPRGDGASLINH